MKESIITAFTWETGHNGVSSIASLLILLTTGHSRQVNIKHTLEHTHRRTDTECLAAPQRH